jgi:hypothetical protein
MAKLDGRAGTLPISWPFRAMGLTNVAYTRFSDERLRLAEKQPSQRDRAVLLQMANFGCWVGCQRLRI